MAKTVEVDVYKFEELSDRAKEEAREWYRSGALDYGWWDFIYEDAANVADILGIDIRCNPVKLMNGSVRHDPCIWFSGFCSQGDGACFEGHYSYKKGSVKEIKKYAPTDKELHSIAERLFDAQRRCFYGLTAKIKHSGHYSHSGCMSIDVSCYDDMRFDEEDIRQPLRDFADWIYKQLEQEHDYLLSDEVVDESIVANEYEFNADGSIF